MSRKTFLLYRLAAWILRTGLMHTQWLLYNSLISTRSSIYRLVEALVMSSSAIAVGRLDRPHGAVGTLVVVKSTLRLRARAATGPLKRNAVALLRPSVDMEVVPHLGNLCAAVVQRSLALSSLVVARTRAAHVRSGAVLCAESLFEVREGVGGAVGGDDVGVGEPLVGV